MMRLVEVFLLLGCNVIMTVKPQSIDLGIMQLAYSLHISYAVHAVSGYLRP